MSASVAKLVADLSERKCLVAVAESCSGGQLSAALTSVPGSSAIFDRGFITYSNQAKHDMLGVPLDLIEKHGAVSREVAIAMAEGALKNSAAEVAVSITGVAGPAGGSDSKPVGLVHFAVAKRNAATRHHQERFGAQQRSLIQSKAVDTALDLIRQTLSD
jgi:nicotinamide-nucleotide amidase